MATRNALKQRLKSASKRRERRQANRQESFEPTPPQDMFSGPRPFDAILEAMAQWSVNQSAATDSDVAAAIREMLTGHTASSAYSRDLVERWTDINDSASWGNAAFRSSLRELNDLARQYRQNTDPRAMIEYISLVVA